MKRLIASTALTIALAAPAFAGTLEVELERFADNVDMTQIDEAAEARLTNVIYSDDPFTEKQAVVDEILRENDAYMENQVTFFIPDSEYAKLDVELDRFGYELDPAMLSNSDRLSASAIIFGGDSISRKQARLDELLDS